MGRRKQSGLLEDVFELLLMCPWWGGVIAAAAFAIIGFVLEKRMLITSTTQVLVPLFRIFFGLFVGVSLLAALMSVIRSASRRRLLDQQQGIDSLRALSWRQFELLVGEAYRRQGYIVEETGGGGPDGGVDLRLSGEEGIILVQCKQWKARQVGVDKVRELFGVVTAQRAAGGILITSGSFTRDAKAFAASNSVKLVDGKALAEFVRTVQHPNQKDQVDLCENVGAASGSPPLCPLCRSSMVLRTARRGSNAGNQFYGCSCYPKCKGTVPIT